jgi:hypothetical protein
MSNSEKSPFVTFLKIICYCALIFGAYVIGDNFGYKRGSQETVDFTLNKLGIEETADDYKEYDIILDKYIVKNNSIDKSIENILSAENLGERAGDLVTDWLSDLFGE